MELETEALLQKWLKIQILKYKLSLIMWIIMILSIVISIWFTCVYVLPPLLKQLANTQKILESVSSLSETSQKQENIFNDLLKSVNR
ncbi:MAG TPA: hypothetical protein VMW29_01775 [Candidatus Bathyarchaeia archaeon]|nr:hypothetical protein [Candidatus Bathyarchaeia archaeon]